MICAEAEARSPKPSLETTGAGQFWREQVAVNGEIGQCGFPTLRKMLADL